MKYLLVGLLALASLSPASQAWAETKSSTEMKSPKSSVTVDDLAFDIRNRGGYFHVSLTAGQLSSTGGDIVSLTWDFGDGTSSTTDEFSEAYVDHHYLRSGTYTATLTAIDSTSASDSATITFTLAEMPVAKVTVDTAYGTAPLTVNFDGSGSVGGPTNYTWRFGDGSPNVTGVSSTSHTYNDPGNYRARLRVRDAKGNMNYAFVDITVTAVARSRPWANMRIDQREVVLGNPHHFSGSNSFDPNPSGGIVAYNWTFDCASPPCTDTGVEVDYTMPSVGNSHAYLQVENVTGEFSAEGELGGVGEIIAVNSGHAPRAVTGMYATEGVAPFALSVDGSNSYDIDGSIVSYFWSFGDPGCVSGCTASTASAGYTYNDPGTYPVRLTVTDNDSNTYTGGPDRGGVIIVYPSATVRANSTKYAKAMAANPARTETMKAMGSICFNGNAKACHDLAKTFRDFGNNFAAAKLGEKACTGGVKSACSLAKLKY